MFVWVQGMCTQRPEVSGTPGVAAVSLLAWALGTGLRTSARAVPPLCYRSSSKGPPFPSLLLFLLTVSVLVFHGCDKNARHKQLIQMKISFSF